jgi:TolB-like protein
MSLIAERKYGSLRKLLFTMIGVLFVAVVYFAVHEFMLDAEPERSSIAREKSILVLPFDDLSGDPEFDYLFADGIHDEILAQLSTIRDLKVIARIGGPFGGPSKNTPTLAEVAEIAGVTHILEGSVRLARNRVLITAQLIEVESEAHLWAEAYDRELTAANIFSIQTEIAKSIADAVRATLLPEEQD